MRTLENPTYGTSSDSKSNGPGDTNEPEHLLMNPLYTIPTTGKNTRSPHTTETARVFTYKNGDGPHGTHPSVPSHLELGIPDEDREYATLQSAGHQYATLEQASNTQDWNRQEPLPYEFPVTLTRNRDASDVGSVGNHLYAKPEPRRQIPNYPPQGYEGIVAMASGGRQYAEPDISHPYATLEPPAS